jgi:4-amino-4-deoxy-L-arabinose transferase-like glycosyltransferase
MKRLAALAAVPLFLWILSGTVFINYAAPTYDEPVHLASGYSYLHTGQFRLNIMDHPPLAEMWAAAALLPLKPTLSRSHPDWMARRLYHFSDYFLFSNGISAQRLMNTARLFSFVTLSVLLAWGLFSWARRLGGDVAGVAALSAAALSPILISNLALVTTDGMPAVLFFCIFAVLSREERTRRHWLAAGACAGAALAAKFSMIILIGFVPALLLIDHGLRRRRYKMGDGAKPRWPWMGIALFCVAAFAVLLVSYRITEIPLYWKGLSATLQRMSGGRSTFLHGEHSVRGFWLYFPAALLLKTPVPLLGLAVGAVLWRGKELKREAVWVVLPPVAYFAIAMTSKVQIGVRHLLPMIPFFALLAGLAAAKLWQAHTRGRLAVGALAIWSLVSVGHAMPYQLAYFNVLAGGPRGGIAWLGDSNLDWGQGLQGLGDAVRELGSPPIYLSYFGSADPHAYGLRYVPVLMCCNVTRSGDTVDPAMEGRVLFALSATNKQVVYFRDKNIFSWLEDVKPLRVIGHSIYLYDLTANMPARKALAQLVMASTNDSGRAKSLLLQSK